MSRENQQSAWGGCPTQQFRIILLQHSCNYIGYCWINVGHNISYRLSCAVTWIRSSRLIWAMLRECDHEKWYMLIEIHGFVFVQGHSLYFLAWHQFRTVLLLVLENWNMFISFRCTNGLIWYRQNIAILQRKFSLVCHTKGGLCTP